MGGLEEAMCIELIQDATQSMRHWSLLERFKLTGTLGCGTHHAVIGADAGHGATIGVGIEAAVGVPKLDPCPLGLQQLSLAGGLQVGAEGFVGFVEPVILQLVFSDDALDRAARDAAGLVYAGGELFAGSSRTSAGRVRHAGNAECGQE